MHPPRDADCLTFDCLHNAVSFCPEVARISSPLSLHSLHFAFRSPFFVALTACSNQRPFSRPSVSCCHWTIRLITNVEGAKSKPCVAPLNHISTEQSTRIWSRLNLCAFAGSHWCAYSKRLLRPVVPFARRHRLRLSVGGSRALPPAHLRAQPRPTRARERVDTRRGRARQKLRLYPRVR